MQNKGKALFVLLTSLVLTIPVTSATPNYLQRNYKGECPSTLRQCHTCGYFELIGAGSVSKVHPGRAELGLTTSETDRLVPRADRWNSWGGQLGLGYVYYIMNALKCSPCLQWFPIIEPQLNVYYISFGNRGDVFRFDDPNFNDLTYRMPTHSIRAMFDVALTIFSWRNFSTYLKAGIGEAWNSLRYSDTFNATNDTCNIQNISLNSKTTSYFAWESGVGALWTFNDRFSASLEYLYSDLGKVSTARTGDLGGIPTPITSPATFNLRAQTVLLGLHVALG